MSVNTNNAKYWDAIKKRKRNKPLTFIHIPKCGGTYIATILSHLGVKNKGHHLATNTDGITFAVIRNPVDRYSSLLNYRLNVSKPRPDCPKSLGCYVNVNTPATLNTIVGGKNVDIFITIDKLQEFLAFFDHEYDANLFEKQNVSKKTQGTFDAQTKHRIAKLYSKDMLFYKNAVLN